jgi:hypothetical protein
MPIDEKILGFGNSWYALAMESPEKYHLTEKLSINLISAPIFIASKLESFAGRGKGDYLHHDIEDIISAAEGRKTIIEEIFSSKQETYEYISNEIETLLGDESFTNLIAGHLNGLDAAARVSIVLSRLRAIVGT